MQLIQAVIRPHKLPGLRDALRALPGFPGMTVLRAEGCGATARHVPQTIREELTDFSERVSLQIIAAEPLVEALVATIVQVAGTGHTGDGLVWVSEVAAVVPLSGTPEAS